jgi:hypothetical protein
MNVDTGSLVIDNVAGTITFTLLSIDPLESNTVTFDTIANGDIGETVHT